MGILPDAVVLGTTIDGILLVVAAGSTPRPQLAKTLKILAFSKARVLGTILNKIDHKKHGYGYGDYYYYSYRYNYGSDGEKGKNGEKNGKKRKK